MSVPVQAGGVPAGDVTGGVGGRAGVAGVACVARVAGSARVARVARVARDGRVARDAEVGARISKVFVTSVQRLALGVVGGTVALEESALELNC